MPTAYSGFPLKGIETLICTTIVPANFSIIDIKPDQIEKCIHYAITEEATLRQYLRLNSINWKSEHEARYKINKLQNYLIEYLNLLHHYNTSTTLPELIHLYSKLTVIFSDLLNYLISFHRSEFNFYAELPDFRKPELITQLKDFIISINTFFTNHNTAPPVIKMLTSILNSYTQDKSSYKLCYNHISYFTELQNALNDNLAEETEDLDQIIISTLHQFNFNDTFFFNYLIGKIKREILSNPEKEKRIQILHFNLKETRQSVSLNDQYILRPGVTLVRTLMSEWLIDEINYHKSAKSKIQYLKKAGVKHKISFTVKELSLILDLLFKNKIFPSLSKIELARLLIENFNSISDKPISEKSLLNHSTQITDLTRSTIKDLFYEFIKQLNKK